MTKKPPKTAQIVKLSRYRVRDVPTKKQNLNRLTAKWPRKLARQPIVFVMPRPPSRGNDRADPLRHVAAGCGWECWRGGVGAPAGRVAVTGTLRKQFFIFYFYATQFSAALPAPPASSIMAP